MKLRNKKTGEIKPWDLVWSDYRIHSLAELNAEWEDYEEPKKYWFITWCGEVDEDTDDGIDVDNGCKAIGNYFETKEKAEKAVEKLKVAKRLEDKGFRFDGWFTRVEGRVQINLNYNKYDGISLECREDLDLLFCPEEKNNEIKE